MVYFKLLLILITTGITIIEVSYKEADKLKEMILYLSKLIKILLRIEYPYALISSEFCLFIRIQITADIITISNFNFRTKKINFIITLIKCTYLIIKFLNYVIL